MTFPTQETQKETCVVTGAAGFIGSHLAEALVTRGYRVIGVDAFVDFYPRAMKEANLLRLRQLPTFHLLEADLRTANLTDVLRNVDYVFHQAAQAGVRTSWGTSFASYVEHNVLSTQRVLEAALQNKVRRVIYASSSSVYGNTPELPAREESPTLPVSPYGVTKLAGEHLCRLYSSEHRLATISLRYFTVYGPRHRPDMAFYKFIRALLLNEPILIYGDGEQSRDFTYVDDIVAGNLAAMHAGRPGASYNLGNSQQVSLKEVLRHLEQITGRQAQVHYLPHQPGDVGQTIADTTLARAELEFQATCPLHEGLAREVSWVTEQVGMSCSGSPPHFL